MSAPDPLNPLNDFIAQIKKIAGEYKEIKKTLPTIAKKEEIKGAVTAQLRVADNGAYVSINRGIKRGVKVDDLVAFDKYGLEGYVLEVFEFAAKVSIPLPNMKSDAVSALLGTLKGFRIPEGKKGDKSSTTAANIAAIPKYLAAQKDADNEALAKAAGLSSYAVIKDSADGFAQQLKQNLRKRFTEAKMLEHIVRTYINDLPIKNKEAIKPILSKEEFLAMATPLVNQLSKDLDKAIAALVDNIVMKRYYLKAKRYEYNFNHDWERIVEQIPNCLLNPKNYSSDREDWIKGINYHTVNDNVNKAYKEQFDGLMSK